MSLKHPRRATALIFALAGAATLSGCGKTGALDRPAPLFGPNRNAPVEQTPQAQDPNRPVTTVDQRDRSTDLQPPRNAPIEGTSPDPFGAAKPGALPDPRTTPDR